MTKQKLLFSLSQFQFTFSHLLQTLVVYTKIINVGTSGSPGKKKQEKEIFARVQPQLVGSVFCSVEQVKQTLFSSLNILRKKFEWTIDQSSDLTLTEATTSFLCK